VALVAVLLYLRRKEKPFCVIDSHAGAGLYDLRGEKPARTGEAEGGIARLRDLEAQPGLPDSLRTYFDSVSREGTRCYPGSPRFAALLLRPQDRLIAFEKHPEEAAALTKALAQFPQARAVEGDGYERLTMLLP